MGFATLSSPGTEYGPCREGCKHIDCVKTREMAGAQCGECGEVIGYQRGFYEMDGGLVHFTCAWDKAEAARKEASG